jgi:hypothetical protein
MAVEAPQMALRRAFSPLADGEDRLFAGEALALGFELNCPLPFSQSEYEKDFPTRERVDEFRALLSRANAGRAPHACRKMSS